jgi:hypothetical protein
VLIVAALAWSPSAAGQVPAREQRAWRDLDGWFVDPLAGSPGARASVLLFVSAQCPISNRYAPEIRRLVNRFSATGVRFWSVYPNPAESTAAVRQHLDDYKYGTVALRDPQQELAHLAGATITPEAVVYDARGRVVYRGRIDDRYVAVGLERAAPERRDLEEALTATLAGTPVRAPATQAVGCYISDFAR